MRTTRVVLAAAHLDNDPANNRLRNLRSLCQRCHMIHDRSYHLAQRWITYRFRYALGDIFLGSYRSGTDRIILPILIAQFASTARLARAQRASPGLHPSASSIQLLLDVQARGWLVCTNRGFWARLGHFYLGGGYSVRGGITWRDSTVGIEPSAPSHEIARQHPALGFLGLEPGPKLCALRQRLGCESVHSGGGKLWILTILCCRTASAIKAAVCGGCDVGRALTLPGGIPSGGLSRRRQPGPVRPHYRDWARPPTAGTAQRRQPGANPAPPQSRRHRNSSRRTNCSRPSPRWTRGG